MSVFIGYPSFMAYQMMKGKKDNNDGFPSIPGMIARYSALGLTNEQMKENPVWVDKTGNGHDLQMKNFLWGEMSGVGGYTESFLGDKVNWESEIYNGRKMSVFGGDRSKVSIIHNQYHFQTYVKISGIDDNEGKVRGVYFYNLESSFTKGTLCKTDGIYKIDITELNERGVVGIWAYPAKKNEDVYDYPVTIEILPLYPGFILGDGVDDFAVTEKELNFEDTYTVYTAFIPFQNNPTKNMMMAGKDIKDFYMNYSSLNALSYYSGNKSVVINLSNGFNLLCCKRDADNMTIKNLITGDSVTATANEFINNPGLYYLWRVANGYSYARLAIAGQTICNGYFSTDEDDEKVLDWYKKQYPWLFPDQAWTVTGKTNEDEDRATIANITGNGNDLVLSNFGFAEGSGYGLYAENYAGGRWVKSTDRADLTWTSYSVNITSVKVASTQLYYQSYPEQPSFIVPPYKIKVYGLKDGQTLSYKQVTSEGQQIYKISEDGIYTLPSFPFKANGDWYGFTLNKVQETCDITIEQIPEYEGYLVTDGVDDSGRAVGLTISKDFTLVGEWILFSKTSVNAGLSIHPQIHIFNRPEAIQIVFRTAGKTLPVKSIKAICSDGRCYDENWSELKINVGEFTDNKGVLFVASNGTNYVKNLGIYNNQILSKDDCIKAYNYLQTLKAK